MGITLVKILPIDGCVELLLLYDVSRIDSYFAIPVTYCPLMLETILGK